MARKPALPGHRVSVKKAVVGLIGMCRLYFTSISGSGMLAFFGSRIQYNIRDLPSPSLVKNP